MTEQESDATFAADQWLADPVSAIVAALVDQGLIQRGERNNGR
ncbi:hypothetical protein [Winogradskya consettensis]|nr:hypothetical protein [Actinoplanes consettensis]